MSRSDFTAPTGRSSRPAGWPSRLVGPTAPAIDPSTGEPYGELRIGSPQEVSEAFGFARAAASELAEMSAAERAQRLDSLASILEGQIDEYAFAESLDTGKTAGAASLAVVTAIEGLRLGVDTLPGSAPEEEWDPLGVVGCILPNNAAIFTAGIKAGAALLAGCPIVMKPPGEAALAVTMLAEDAERAGLPPGSIVSIPGGADVSQAILSERPQMVSFTGSRHVGNQVAMRAGELGIPVKLELGGGATVLVLPEADVQAAVNALTWGAFANQGQVCVAAKIVRVHVDLYDDVVEALAEAAANLRIGVAYDDAAQLGPLHTADRLASVSHAVASLEGVLRGGGPVQDESLPPNGYYFEPTVVAGELVPKLEVFGPVVAVTPYSRLDEVIERTNKTMSGIAAGVWGPADEARRVGHQLQTGQVYINRHFNPTPGTFAAEPWGESGFGRNDPVDFLRRRRYYEGS